jgi:hypothetical protein
MMPKERMTMQRFLGVACKEASWYIAMMEKDVEEEYCLARKLHKYDPDTEWMNQCARVTRMYPARLHRPRSR